MKKNTYGTPADGFDSRLGHKETPENTGVSISQIKSMAKSTALFGASKPYKPARLYRGNHKEWYVEFYYLKPDGSGYKRFKHTFDIGRIRTRYGDDAAVVYGEECCAILNKQLAAGLNPFTQQLKKSKATAADTLQQLINKLSEGASQYSINTYTEQLNRFKKFAPVIAEPGFSIADFSTNHAQRYVEALQAAGLSSKTINGSISYQKTFWKHLKKEGYVVSNVWDGIERIKKRTASNRYEPFTAGEIEKIFAHLKSIKQTQFLCFCQFVFYAWARPAEIRRLRIGDIDLQQRVIRFPATSTKNKKGAYVQIVPPLADAIAAMQLEKYPSSYYVFGRGKMVPSKYILDDASLWARWRLHVHDKLGITKTMYALKHTGNIFYIQNNKGRLDLKWQQMQNRHSSAAMTEKYIRELGAYFIDTTGMKWG